MGICFAKRNTIQKLDDHLDTTQTNPVPNGPYIPDGNKLTVVKTTSTMEPTLEMRYSNQSNTLAVSRTNMLDDVNLFAHEAVRISYQFWNDNVLTLSEDNRKEIGVTLYAQMYRKMPKCRKIFLRGEIQRTSEKFLNMIGWLVTELHRNYEVNNANNNDDTKSDNKMDNDTGNDNRNIMRIKKTNVKGYNVWEKLVILGKSHEQWGVSYENFLPMLEAFHKTFQDRFPKGYTMRVKFCIENLYMNAARLMTKKDFHTLFMERVRDLETLEFLDSLDACLAHPTGREYLERYMEQCFMKEYVLFFRLFDEYKQLGNTGQRYEKAREIYYTNFDINGHAIIDIDNIDGANESINVLKNELNKFDKALENKQTYELSDKLLDDIYGFVKKIIEEQSWLQFCDGINSIKEATRPKQRIDEL